MAPGRAHLVCANHTAVPAELECAPCGAVFCAACARRLRDGRTMACLRCGSMLVPFAGSAAAIRSPVSRAPERADAARPLIDRLPSTLTYVLKGRVLLVLAGVALLQLLGNFGLILAILAAGINAAVFFRIVETSAYGDDRLEPPDFVDPWESVLAPLLRYLATLVPLVAILLAAGVPLALGLFIGPRLWIGLGAWFALILVWIALWPVLIIVAALTRSITAIYRPSIWVKILGEMRTDYLIGAACFYGTFLIELYVLVPIALRLAISTNHPIVVAIVFGFIGLVLEAWRARVLGETCRPYLEI